jgi:hypothetical protein
MKVKFLKDHLQYKAGQSADLADGLAKYLIAVGVCDGKKKKKEKNVNAGPNPEKDNNSGPNPEANEPGS